MAVKTDRIEARLSPAERERIERAAALLDRPVSTFVVESAVERADEVIHSATTTVVPAAFFDALLAELDEPDPAPTLARAAARSRRRAGGAR
jgi:uncharacterized protein (DUF1778 family)